MEFGPLRITVFVNNFQMGGAERAAVNLANSLHRAGKLVTILVVRNDGPLRKRVLADIPIRSLNRSRAFWSVFALHRHLNADPPDVFVSEMTIANTLAGLARPWGLSTKFVGIEHGDMAESFRVDSGSRLRRLGYRLASVAYRRLDSIVCVDSSTAISVRNFLRSCNLPIAVLPNPVIVPEIDEQMMVSSGHRWLLDKTLPVFLSVGRLAEQKNHELLLEAFVLVQSRQPSRLILLGDGELRKPIEAKCIELGIRDSVDIVGAVENPYCYMRESDVLVLSSRWEALPTVLIEAQYVGIQVVTTPASEGTLRIVGYGKYGFVADPPVVENLAECMFAALNSPKDLALLRGNAQAYSSEKVATAYLDHFRTLRRS